MGDDGQVPAVQLAAETAKPQVTVREALSSAIAHGLCIAGTWLVYVVTAPKMIEMLRDFDFGGQLALPSKIVFGISDLLVKLWFLGPVLILAFGFLEGWVYLRLGNSRGRGWARAWSYLVLLAILVILFITVEGMFMPLVVTMKAK